jgi:glycerol-3-phosphate dehydrogenase (NAD(P)+)
MKARVLGSGSWGTALAVLLARNGREVTLLGRNEEEIQILKSCRENLKYLPGFALPQEITFGLLADSTDDSNLDVIAVPASAVRQISAKYVRPDAIVVVCSKGLEMTSAQLVTEVVEETLPNATVGVLSGPNLAVEIVRGIPTVAVAAFKNLQAAEQTRDAFNRSTFRVSVADDVIGVELGGALKNVLAVGAGMSDGLGFGDNTKGAFLSRGLMEIARLGSAMGARAETFLGPTGVGDLFATANSRLSRNYRLGLALGSGEDLPHALAKLGQVAEGVPTSEAVQVLARKHNVEMPVFAAVEAVIRGKLQPAQAVTMLMERAPKMDDFLTTGTPKNA